MDHHDVHILCACQALIDDYLSISPSWGIFIKYLREEIGPTLSKQTWTFSSLCAATQMRFDALLFDFDYTLADSSVGVVDCIGYSLRELGLPPATGESIRRTIGLSMPETLRRLAGDGHDDKAAEFFRLFVERADQVMVDGTVVFPEVGQALPVLQQRGTRLGIVSTKFRHRIRTILQRDGLLDLFDTIVGGEDVSAPKPDPGGLLVAMERLGVSPGDALYVGDSTTDAETARRATTPFAAVLTGVTPAEAFRPYPALGLFADLTALQTGLFH